MTSCKIERLDNHNSGNSRVFNLNVFLRDILVMPYQLSLDVEVNTVTIPQTKECFFRKPL